MSETGTGTDRAVSPPALARAGLFAGPAVFAVLFLAAPPAGLSEAGWSAVAVIALMAVWWFSQAIPLAATALLPALLFPVLGIGSLTEATVPYAHPLIFLFLGGFVIALTVERWNLHRRLAIAVIALAGSGPARLTGGFMLATAGLSMWVSNTATTLMMVPIALSVISFVDTADGAPDRRIAVHRFGCGLLIAIAYAASIGGLATLIGTPPNAFLAGYMNQTYGTEIGFGQWMLLGLPVSAAMLALAWLLLTRLLFRADDVPLDRVRAGLAEERRRLGPAGRGERMTAVLFGAVALAWMFQPLIARAVPIGDTGIALAGALAAFVLPVSLRGRVFLMDWRDASRLPWDILLLFGGGLSLASAIESTGLASWLGTQFAGADRLPLVAVLLLVTAFVVFLTELASNTATAAVFIPVAATLSAGMGADPLMLAAPVALAASCAFMMPVATPPNAIVFGAGRLTVLQMCHAGIFLNLIGIAAICIAALYLLPLVFPAG